MKSLHLLAYLAAVAALVVRPLQIEITISLLLVAGLGLFLTHEVSGRRPLTVPAARRPRRLKARFHPPALEVSLSHLRA